LSAEGPEDTGGWRNLSTGVAPDGKEKVGEFGGAFEGTIGDVGIATEECEIHLGLRRVCAGLVWAPYGRRQLACRKWRIEQNAAQFIERGATAPEADAASTGKGGAGGDRGREGLRDGGGVGAVKHLHHRHAVDGNDRCRAGSCGRAEAWESGGDRVDGVAKARVYGPLATLAGGDDWREAL